jgi:cytochrome P450
VHIFSTHNSGRYWERPDEFLPERFLQPGAEYAGKGPPDQQAAGGPDPFMPGSPAEAAAVSAGGAGPGPASPIRAGSGRAMGLGDASRPLRFFPFSQGARDCIGQALARMDYLAMLAALLGRYNFRLTPEVRCRRGMVRRAWSPLSSIRMEGSPGYEGPMPFMLLGCAGCPARCHTRHHCAHSTARGRAPGVCRPASAWRPLIRMQMLFWP